MPEDTVIAAPIRKSVIERLRDKTCPIVKFETTLGEFFARRQTAADQFRFLAMQSELQKLGHTHLPAALVVAASLINEDGTYVWPDAEEGYLFLQEKEGDVVQELFRHLIEITGLREHAVEEAEKKSSSSQSENSGTNSPSSSEAAP